MEVICNNAVLSFSNSSVFINNYEIPLFKIRDLVVFSPFKNNDGVLQLTLYDFYDFDETFLLFPFSGEDNTKHAFELSDIIHNYEPDIDGDCLSFINFDEFWDIRDKKAYIKFLSIINSSEDPAI